MMPTPSSPVTTQSDTLDRFGFVLQQVLGWFGCFRRLSKDYEYELESSETLIYAAMSHPLLRRLAKQAPAVSSPDG